MYVYYDGNMQKFLDPLNAKIEKNIRQRKIITHKTVFIWFGNLPMSTELQGFHYSQGKIQSAIVHFFSLKTTSNPNLQNNGFYILHMGFIMSVMAWAYWPKLPVHGLSLRKFPIKDYNNIISNRVINRIKHNQAPQNPTILIGNVLMNCYLFVN